MSSAYPDAPTLSPDMQRPWPVVSRCFSRESITMMNRVGDRTDPCFTPRLTGKHSENWLSSLTTLIDLEYQFFMRRQNLPFTPTADPVFEFVLSPHGLSIV